MKEWEGAARADHYTRDKVTAVEVIMACEVLLLAGFTQEALSVLAATVKDRRAACVRYLEAQQPNSGPRTGPVF